MAIACLLVMCGTATGDPPRVTPDPPARRTPPTAGGPSTLGPSWDLDGTYVWLGPTGAASHVAADWDSTFGGDLAVLRIRERRTLAAIGATLGGATWTARGGGRLWLDALAGTRIAGRMVGVSAGPILELAELAHPRPGASVGLWVFAGVTPFARVGAVQELGTFAEIGLHIALPVYRR